jgi:hypothetical protein
LWNRARYEARDVDPVAHRLAEIPMNLERDPDRPRRSERELEAAPEPMRALGLGRRFPSGGEERVDRGIAILAAHEQVDVVERSLVESAVEPVEHVDALQRHRTDPARREDVYRLLHPREQQQIVDPGLRTHPRERCGGVSHERKTRGADEKSVHGGRNVGLPAEREERLGDER